MDQGMMFNTAALGTSLVAVTTSTLLAVRHLRTVQATNPTLVIVELLTRERRSSEFLGSEDYVLRRLAVEHQPDQGINGLPPEARGHALRIGLYYTNLGMLSAFRGAHSTVLLSAVWWNVQVTWSVLEPYILAERRLRNNLYMSYFEHLVCLASTTDKATLLQRQGLRRLPHTTASQVVAPQPAQAMDSAGHARPAALLGLVSGALASTLLPRRRRGGPTPLAVPRAAVPRPADSAAPGDDAVVARLASELVEARESATRADDKATTLLGGVGGASVIIVTVLAAAGSRGDTGAWTALALVMGWIGAAMLTAAATLLVLAVRPHLRILRPTGRQVSWMRFIGMRTAGEVVSAVRAEVETQPREALLAARLLPLAELAHRKHRLIRTAADLVLAATIVVAAAALLYALVA
jgi:hypothetical protein